MRGFWIGVAVFVGACYLYFNYVAYPAIYFRYRLTVEVQTPDGIKAESVVNEDVFSFSWANTFFNSGIGAGQNRGEALYMDLGGGKNLVVTNYADDQRPATSVVINDGSVRRIETKDDDSKDSGVLGLYFCNLNGRNNGGYYDCHKSGWNVRSALADARKIGPFAVNIQHLPTLLTFADLADYKSMLRVDPSHLDQVFGAGYAIKSVTVEIVDEPLTERIEGQLPWLGMFKNTGASFAGTQSAGPKTSLLSHLGFGSFKLDGK